MTQSGAVCQMFGKFQYAGTFHYDLTQIGHPVSLRSSNRRRGLNCPYYIQANTLNVPKPSYFYHFHLRCIFLAGEEYHYLKVLCEASLLLFFGCDVVKIDWPTMIAFLVLCMSCGLICLQVMHLRAE
jgi:hypothetical protein